MQPIEKPNVPVAHRMIAVEGMDGAGKTTIVKRLVPYLEESIAKRMAALDSNGWPVVSFGPWGEPDSWTYELRTILCDGVADNRIEMLLATAARRKLVIGSIKPALAHGKFVVLDRYVATTFAYQSKTNDDLRLCLDMARDFLECLLPGLTIYLQVGAGQALSRVADRGDKDSIESRDGVFFAKLDQKFRLAFAILASISNSYAITVDASKSLEEVWQSVTEAADMYLDLMFAVGDDREKALAALNAVNIVRVEEGEGVADEVQPT